MSGRCENLTNKTAVILILVLANLGIGAKCEALIVGSNPSWLLIPAFRQTVAVKIIEHMRMSVEELSADPESNKDLLRKIFEAQLVLGDVDGAIRSSRYCEFDNQPNRQTGLLSSSNASRSVIAFLARPENLAMRRRQEILDKHHLKLFKEALKQPQISNEAIETELLNLGAPDLDSDNRKLNPAANALCLYLANRFRRGEFEWVGQRIDEVQNPDLQRRITYSLLFQTHTSDRFQEGMNAVLAEVDVADIQSSFIQARSQAARIKDDFDTTGKILTHDATLQLMSPLFALDEMRWLCQNDKLDQAESSLDVWWQKIITNDVERFVAAEIDCKLLQIVIRLERHSEAERLIAKINDRIREAEHDENLQSRFQNTFRHGVGRAVCKPAVKSDPEQLLELLTSIEDPIVCINGLARYLGFLKGSENSMPAHLAFQHAFESLQSLPPGEQRSNLAIQLAHATPISMKREAIKQLNPYCQDPHCRGDFVCQLMEQALRINESDSQVEKLIAELDNDDLPLYHRDSACQNIAEQLTGAGRIVQAIAVYKSISFVDCVDWALRKAIEDLLKRQHYDELASLFDHFDDYDIAKVIGWCSQFDLDSRGRKLLWNNMEKHSDKLADSSAYDLGNACSVLGLTLPETESMFRCLSDENRKAHSMFGHISATVESTELNELANQLDSLTDDRFKEASFRYYFRRLAIESPREAWNSLGKDESPRQHAARLLGIVDPMLNR